VPTTREDESRRAATPSSGTRLHRSPAGTRDPARPRRTRFGSLKRAGAAVASCTSAAAPAFSSRPQHPSQLSDKQIAFTIAGAVRRRRVLVSVLLALSGLGWAAAHALAHRTVMGEASPSANALTEYLSYSTTSLALCLALALPLAAGAMAGKRWQGDSVRSLWLFGLVPIVGFLAHELTGPLFGSAHGSDLSALAPVVLVGLAVQIPFALVAVGLARRVLWLVETLARALVQPSRAHEPEAAQRFPHPHTTRASRFRLDLAHAQRAPPPLPA
jgi:hypothetical protein